MAPTATAWTSVVILLAATQAPGLAQGSSFARPLFLDSSAAPKRTLTQEKPPLTVTTPGRLQRPPPASPPAPKPQPPASQPNPPTGGAPPNGQPTGQKYLSLATIFDGFGKPYGGCGVPMEQMVDLRGVKLPFIALNTFKADGVSTGMFDHGGNCGRWIQFKTHNPCGNGNRGDDVAGCLADFNGGVADQNSGKTLYAMVGDSCGDPNSWCRQDQFHLDISRDYMVSSGVFDNWQNRRIEWSFLSGPPPGGMWTLGDPTFLYCANAELQWLCIIIAQVTNGVSKFEVQTADGGWRQGVRVGFLGQQYQFGGDSGLMRTNNRYTVRPYAYDGKLYGTYTVRIPFVKDGGVSAARLSEAGIPFPPPPPKFTPKVHYGW